MNNIELLAPAGNMEKLRFALAYGADAVYFGGSRFGLRAYAGNFGDEEIEEAVKYTHSLGRKAYVTVNIFPHNEDLIGLEDYLKYLSECNADAILVSDPGVFAAARQTVPDMPVHISTQSNNVNYKSAMFWYNLGAKRIVLARELSLKEIREIREKTPPDLELEAFVHGAMCISYSGRCLLSSYMTGRDSNRGECAHPCRYKYYLMEEKRPGQYMPIEEDDRGTYIMNSKDLCMIEHIPEIIDAGITSLKIEGRMKSAFYVATVVKAYRKAIDSYLKDKTSYKFDPALLHDLEKASHRQFSTGFYFSDPGQVYESSAYVRGYDIVGIVMDYDKEKGIAKIEQRNRVFKGDTVEIFSPDRETFPLALSSMRDEEGIEIDSAPHPQQIFYIKCDSTLKPMDILIKEKEE